MSFKILPAHAIELQEDDGSRNALDMFMKHKAEKIPAFLGLLIEKEEFWKARVLLELIWEYEKNLTK